MTIFVFFLIRLWIDHFSLVREPVPMTGCFVGDGGVKSPLREEGGNGSC